MNTHHLSVDRVSLTGIGLELDGPERVIVRRKGQRGRQEEEGDSSHGWGAVGGVVAKKGEGDPRRRAGRVRGSIYIRLDLADLTLIGNPVRAGEVDGRLGNHGSV